MPSLTFASSEGWELWGKEFTRLGGLFQLRTQQEKQNECNLLSGLIFHYYENKYTSAQRRAIASRMHMSPGGRSPPQLTNTTQPPTKAGLGGRVTDWQSFPYKPSSQSYTHGVTWSRDKPTIETPQMLPAGLCPGPGTCPRSGSGSGGQNVATVTQRQSCPHALSSAQGAGAKSRLTPTGPAGNACPARQAQAPQGSLLVFGDQAGAAQPCLPG